MLSFRSSSLALALLICHSALIVHATLVDNWTINLGSPSVASPLVRDLDNDGDLEILVSSLIGQVFLLDHLGNTLRGWPKTTALFQRTSPSVGDIDGDGAPDIVVGDNDGYLHAWELDGTIKTGFPIELDGSIKSVVRLIDVDGDQQDELLVHTGASKLYLLNGTGSSLSGWPVDLGGDKDQFGSWIIASTPVVLDFNFDGSLEIAVGTTADNVQIFNLDGTAVSGWSVSTGDWVYPSITAVDLDGDHELELVAGSGDGQVYAWAADGNIVSGFPIDIGQPIVASIATANLTADSGPELVVADLSGNVYCYTSSGQLLDGWPQKADSGIVGSPIIVDTNNDGRLDIVVPSRDNTLHIWNTDGSRISSPSLSATDWIESTPTCADIDADGILELLYTSYDGLLYCAQLSTTATDFALGWPAFLGDQASALNGPSGDTDADLLPDSYELSTFGTIDYDASDDTDNDRSTNYDEWITATDPTDSNDRFTVTSAVSQSPDGAEMTLSWRAKAGRNYNIIYTHSLAPNTVNWQPLPDQASDTVITDEQLQCYIPIPDGAAQCFYKVQVSRN